MDNVEDKEEDSGEIELSDVEDFRDRWSGCTEKSEVWSNTK